jgi:hypothetical protein
MAPSARPWYQTHAGKGLDFSQSSLAGDDRERYFANSRCAWACALRIRFRRAGRPEPRLAVHDRADDARPKAAPKLIRGLYDAYRGSDLFAARAAQEDLAALRQATKPGGAPTLKAALRLMGRDCGAPRPPLLPLDDAAAKALADELGRIPALAAEPRGW